MPRPLRLDHPGAFFHITARGNEKQNIFRDVVDRRCFLACLARAIDRYGVACHAYCLMGNHYHALLESTTGRMSEALQFINGGYARFVNQRHGRVGHLFQGRFVSKLIEQSGYLAAVTRYIELNPCRTGWVRDPADWQWSSFRATAGLARVPRFLTVELVLGQFGDDDGAPSRYQAFVRAGLIDDRFATEIRSSTTILGSETFRKTQRRRLSRSARRRRVPRHQQYLDRPSLASLFGEADTPERRRLAAALAHVRYGYRMTEIGAALGVHYTTVSRWLATVGEQVRCGGSECDDSQSDPPSGIGYFRTNPKW